MPLPLGECLGGIFPALPTPMKSGGEVDVRGLEALVDYVIKGGVHGLWVLGSTSEFPVLSAADRKLITDVTLTCAGGRIPVIIGAIDNDVRKIIANAEAAHSAGAAACFITLPFYFIVDQPEAIRFVREIAQNAPLPIVLYDNPPSTQIRLTVETLLEMSGSNNLVAFKDSSSDFVRFQISLLMMGNERSLKMFQGIDQLVAASLMMGGDGAIVALASVAPRLFVKLYAAAKAHDPGTSVDLQNQILQLCTLYSLAGQSTDGAFFAGVKAALEVLGICGRTVSQPFQEMPKNKMREVERLLRRFEPSFSGEVDLAVHGG
jgi:dihydrodipicolinate synthase/N-acetylneuraminate lyase